MWSSEDEAGDDASSESDTESRPMNTLVSIGSSGSDHEESSEGDLPPVNLVLRMRFVFGYLQISLGLIMTLLQERQKRTKRHKIRICRGQRFGRRNSK